MPIMMKIHWHVDRTCVLFSEEELCSIPGTCRRKRICRYGVCSKKNDTDTGNRCRAEMESDSGSSDHTDQKKKYVESLKDYRGEVNLLGSIMRAKS